MSRVECGSCGEIGSVEEHGLSGHVGAFTLWLCGDCHFRAPTLDTAAAHCLQRRHRPSALSRQDHVPDLLRYVSTLVVKPNSAFRSQENGLQFPKTPTTKKDDSLGDNSRSWDLSLSFADQSQSSLGSEETAGQWAERAEETELSEAERELLARSPSPQTQAAINSLRNLTELVTLSSEETAFLHDLIRRGRREVSGGDGGEEVGEKEKEKVPKSKEERRSSCSICGACIAIYAPEDGRLLISAVRAHVLTHGDLTGQLVCPVAGCGHRSSVRSALGAHLRLRHAELRPRPSTRGRLPAQLQQRVWEEARLSFPDELAAWLAKDRARQTGEQFFAYF